jgi:hypothetical protein
MAIRQIMRRVLPFNILCMADVPVRHEGRSRHTRAYAEHKIRHLYLQKNNNHTTDLLK